LFYVLPSQVRRMIKVREPFNEGDLEEDIVVHKLTYVDGSVNYVVVVDGKIAETVDDMLVFIETRISSSLRAQMLLTTWGNIEGFWNQFRPYLKASFKDLNSSDQFYSHVKARLTTIGSILGFWSQGELEKAVLRMGGQGTLDDNHVREITEEAFRKDTGLELAIVFTYAGEKLGKVDSLRGTVRYQVPYGTTLQAFLTKLREDGYVKDQAMVEEGIMGKADWNRGGIDLNPALLDLQIKRDGKGIPLPLNQQPILQMRIEGFFPVIIDVVPINLPVILGLGDMVPSEPMDTAKDEEGRGSDLSYMDKRGRFDREILGISDKG